MSKAPSPTVFESITLFAVGEGSPLPFDVKVTFVSLRTVEDACPYGVHS